MRYRTIIQIMLLIISVTIIFTLVKPKFSDIQAAQDSASRFADAAKSANEYNQRAKALVDRVNSISQRDIGSLNKFLPTSVDNTQVASDIRNMVESSGLLLLDVGTPQDSDTVTVSVGEEMTVVGETEGSDLESQAVNEMESSRFTVEAVGTYGQFVQMLKILESNNYPLIVENLSFQTKEDSNLFTFSLELETYALKQ